MARVILFISILLSMAFSHAQTSAETAQKTAQDFYTWVFNHQTSPLPSKIEMKTLSPFISKNLTALIERSRVVEAECIKRTPKGDKPPLFEGALLVGNYEGADEVLVGTVQVSGSNATLQSRLFMIDKRFPKAHPYRVYSWVDGLKLSDEQGHWVVTDILRQNQSSLVKELTDYVKENQYCSSSK